MKKNHTSHPSPKGLFDALAVQAITKNLTSRTISRQYENGESIFSQGDIADSMFRVEHGNVKLAVRSSGGRKAAIAILRAGDCFGEGCLVANTPRTCSATSIQKSTIGRISKRTMNRRLRDEPAFAKLLFSHLLLQITRIEEDLVDQRVNSSEMRLARLLLQLSDFGRLSGRPPSTVVVDQASLAQVVGTTRSRVSHFMNEFRKKGFIDYNGSLRVHKGLFEFVRRAHP